jgi:heme exporter protein D
MMHSGYVMAAFVVTAIGTVVLLVHSWLGMRRAEALAEDLRQQQ